MEPTYADSWSAMAQPCDMDLWAWSGGQHDLYFMVQWFCLIFWRQFNVCTSYFGSMNQYDLMFYLKINVGHCDLYSMVHWFCLISWRLFNVWTILFGIMSQYDLKINIGHCDLYFMVQCFCLMSWRLFDVCTSYFGSMNQYDLMFDLGERGGSVVECRTPEREVGGSIPTVAVLCPWARHFTPRKYWLTTQEAVAPSRHDWKIVDWDVKPQHKQKPKK